MIPFVVKGNPFGVNQAYRTGKHGGFYKTAEAEAFQFMVKMNAKRAMRGEPPLKGPVVVALHNVWDSHRCDVDGPIKLTLDAMQDVLYENDRQVAAVLAVRGHDLDNPRQTISVQPFADHGEGFLEMAAGNFRLIYSPTT